ncbi:MAG: DUF4296 domain-containing protein, partial [Cyclobacteriaceae bacterium]
MSILGSFSVYPTVNLTKGVRKMMGWKKWVWLAGLLCLAGCVEEKKPEGILSKEEMVDLMVDVYIAEAKLSIYRIPFDSAMKLFYPFEEKTLGERGLSDSTFKANYERSE